MVPGELPGPTLPDYGRFTWTGIGGAWQAGGRGRAKAWPPPRGPRPGAHLIPVAPGTGVSPQKELQHRQVPGRQLAGLPGLPAQGPGSLRVPPCGLPAAPHLSAFGSHPWGGVGQGLLWPGHQGMGHAREGGDHLGVTCWLSTVFPLVSPGSHSGKASGFQASWPGLASPGPPRASYRI